MSNVNNAVNKFLDKKRCLELPESVDVIKIE